MLKKKKLTPVSTGLLKWQSFMESIFKELENTTEDEKKMIREKIREKVMYLHKRKMKAKLYSTKAEYQAEINQLWHYYYWIEDPPSDLLS